MLSRSRALPAAVLMAALLGLSGCGNDTDEPTTTASDSAGASDSPTASTSPSETAAPSSARTDFCAQIPRPAIRTALYGAAIYDEAWTPGKDADVRGGVHAAGAEFGCAWTAKDGTTVTAWLFAAPVSADEGATLVKKAGAGCEHKKVRAPGADAAVTVQCISDDDTVTRTQALYGDAWLSCSLQTPGILTRLDRAADWCDAVREAALV